MREETELYAKAVKLWGEQAQEMMVIEECSELIKALCKYRRGKCTIDDLINEMVDVQITLNQLRFIVNDESKWQRWWDYKLSRLKDMLVENQPGKR